MSVDDPLVNGVPLSSLRVVDLKDELDKRGLSKIGNKSVLTERLKAYICENELQNCGENAENATPEKSPPKVASPENPLVAAYLARQAETLEKQKKDAERIRKEKEAAGEANIDEELETKQDEEQEQESRPAKSPRRQRQHSESQDQVGLSLPIYFRDIHEKMSYVEIILSVDL
ncbi:SAP domain protein [Ancylostoma caninum]|uniref:SAP domain protein n=1 Tax=Ancylostoma caninum TaxID=29170 RepID=A0A368GY07_ANCCA|nr:SAP domain protein [Ancylostoma caninum]